MSRTSHYVVILELHRRTLVAPIRVAIEHPYLIAVLNTCNHLHLINNHFVTFLYPKVKTCPKVRNSNQAADTDRKFEREC